MCVYMYQASMFKFDWLGGRRPTRAPQPPERHTPGPAAPTPNLQRPDRALWGTEPGIHGHEVLAPATLFISCVADDSRARAASSSSNVSSSTVVTASCASSSSVCVM